MPHPMFDLNGQRALDTGESLGIGLALAQGFSQAGARVVINGRDEERARSAAANTPEAEVLVFDVTDHDTAREAVDGYEADSKSIDVLFDNADIQHHAPLQVCPADAFDRLLQTNVASVQTALARPGIAPYTATKGAVGNLTKGMATDWARFGLTCNATALGYFETPLNAALLADPEFDAWLKKYTPAGRWGKVEERQGTCIFLASDAANCVFAHLLYVDGRITVSL